MKRLMILVAVWMGAFSYSVSDIPSTKQTNQVTWNWAHQALQGFNMRVWLSNQMTLGLQAWDCGSGDCIPREPHLGLEYPLGSNIEHLYGAGPWIGAIVNGVRRVTEGYNGYDASKELVPDYAHLPREHFWHTSVAATQFDSLGYDGYYYNHSIIVNRKGTDDDNDGKVDEDDLDGLDNDGDWIALTDDVGSDGLPDSIEISCDGIPFDPISNPDPAGDNYDPSTRDKCHPDANGNYPYKNNLDRYTERNGIPDHGEPHVDEDYGAISDNDLYCSANDTVKRLVDQFRRHVPIGVKVTQKSYAWRFGAAVDAIVFLEYTFVNVGKKNWQDAYVGFFADMDVGPVNVSGYYQNNCAAYDTLTHTGYVYNPIDRGSTPLGLTLLKTSKPLDSLKYIFQWFDYTTSPGPGTNDSDIYSWMSGEAVADSLIKPNKDPANPADTRFLFSFGPFPTLTQYDTVRAVFALVSGMTNKEMLANARRARSVFESNYFIMPAVHIIDSGGSNPVRLWWNRIQSPFGAVSSYRVYFGTTAGSYTDSLTTSDSTVSIGGLTAGQSYFFVVAGFDDKGNRSALSDEVTNAPSIPSGLTVIGQQRSIHLQWNVNADPDIAGYNVYRYSSLDPTLTKMNASVLSLPYLLDTAVWGNRTYFYQISAVDHDGHEGMLSDVVHGHLIPPSVPSNFLIAAIGNSFYLEWAPNPDVDIAGYNVYRRGDHDTNFIKLNNNLLLTPNYRDLSVQKYSGYFYVIESVDQTEATNRTSPVHTRFPEPNGKIFLTVVPKPIVILDARAFYDTVFSAYRGRIEKPYYWIPVSDANLTYDMVGYSSMIVIFETGQQPQPYVSPLPGYPLGLKAYLMSGGKLFIVGRGLLSNSYPYWYQFLSDIFGIALTSEIDSTSNFFGANGYGGFPSLQLDAAKVAPFGGRLNYVERFAGVDSQQVIYRYVSNPFDPAAEGKPVGVRAKDSTFKAYYISVPLFYLDTVSARALVQKVLTDFGEMPTSVVSNASLPTEYRLYDAYPNPFNPSTDVRFEICDMGAVSLKVYDVLGREVAVLVDEVKRPGVYSVRWNAGNYPSGVYFCRMTTDRGFQSTKKILLAK